ncbi:hypothetical protein [Actinokineospora terrae]|uniref:Lipoprotein n=1 Tax=Actinokineospora terrae TaxID=155974 RepID=A0A1H9X2P6_9PSEU|nr:hypothetical protein [Actinokineospora terrae]SES40478.1 hypothetical protein SAMN04487818_112210 [Actinokineospora terrae]
MSADDQTRRGTTARALPRWVVLAAVVAVASTACQADQVGAPTTASSTQPDVPAVAAKVLSGRCAGGWVVPDASAPVPLTDPATPPGGAVQADQGLVVVTVQGHDRAQVVVEGMKVDIVARRPAVVGALLPTPCETDDDGPSRVFGVDLNDDTPVPTGRYDDDGRETGYPYKVTAVERGEIRLVPSVATDDVEWRLRLLWTSDGRQGETVVDDGGAPFHTTGTTAVTGALCPDVAQGAWVDPTTSTTCATKLSSATDAGLVGRWVRKTQELAVAPDGTVTLSDREGDKTRGLTLRILSVVGTTATADVVRADHDLVRVGDRYTLTRSETELVVEGAFLDGVWCSPTTDYPAGCST